MLFLLATFAAASAAAHAPASATPAGHCPPAQITLAKDRSPARGLHRLGEEPPASEYLAVERTFDGCPAPAIVRTGLGR